LDARTSFPARHWYRLSPLAVALAPASLVFGLAVVLRRAAYAAGLFTIHRLPVPVVVVGNRVVGGTGKTPLVLWLVEALRGRGLRPGIVSRGYRGAGDPARGVPAGGDPAQFGDEPVLLAERSGVPVWIGRDRVAAARGLLAAHPDRDVLVCDDGLQHYALGRDVEIAVEDERGNGNGLLLPAGPLREPAARPVDAVVVNGAARAGAFEMRLVPDGFRRVGGDGDDVPLAALRGKRLHAAAGIGNPRRFFDTLRALGLDFAPHAFPDHHPWTADDLAFSGCDLVLMTEKDAVKCRAFGRDDLVALRVQARVDPRLAELVAARIHGPQAA
jgi:tetraacyldisaccharide 4'-kinase